MIASLAVAIAGAPSPAAKALDRLAACLAGPGAVSMRQTFRVGTQIGSATFVVRRLPGGSSEARWDATTPAGEFLYVTDGVEAIETSVGDRLYFRAFLEQQPIPSGRLFDVSAFPYIPFEGGIPIMRQHIGRVVDVRKGGVDTLSLVQTSGERRATIVATIDRRGRLLKFSVGEGGGGSTSTFADYKFGLKPPVSEFAPVPPIGSVPLVFERPRSPLQTGQGLGSATVQGPSGPTTLAALAGRGPAMLVFLEGDPPAGLDACMARLRRAHPRVRLVAVTVGPGLPGVPSYRGTEATLDAARIEATPQFYLFQSNRLVQAWVGFDAAAADRFLAEASSALLSLGAKPPY